MRTTINKQEDFYDDISAIIKTFKPFLKANECTLTALETEFGILFNHVITFLKKKEFVSLF